MTTLRMVMTAEDKPATGEPTALTTFRGQARKLAGRGVVGRGRLARRDGHRHRHPVATHRLDEIGLGQDADRHRQPFRGRGGHGEQGEHDQADDGREC